MRLIQNRIWIKFGYVKHLTLIQLKKIYHEISTIYHPDKDGGNNKIMTEINSDYDNLKILHSQPIHQVNEVNVKFEHVRFDMKPEYDKKENTSIYGNVSNVEISLEDVYYGMYKMIVIKKQVNCHINSCDNKIKCSYCHNGYRYSMECQECNGTGMMINDNCVECGGFHNKIDYDYKKIKIPFGADNGDEIEFYDIKVKFHYVQNDKILRLNRYDLKMECAFSHLDENKVKKTITFMNKTYSLDVSKLKDNQLIKLKGLGITYLNKTGDLYIEIKK
jgi:DnaJ-class molecular chaperone